MGRLAAPSIVMLLLAPPAGAGQIAAAEQVAQLSWLEGNWEGMFGRSPYEERYSSPRGGQILWMSKTYSGDRAVYFEFGTFEVIDGRTAYVPYPKGSRRDPFFLKETGPGSREVFEDPDNDFPTKFIFESPTPDQLHITLLGPDGEAGRKQRIEMKRTP